MSAWHFFQTQHGSLKFRVSDPAPRSDTGEVQRDSYQHCLGISYGSGWDLHSIDFCLTDAQLEDLFAAVAARWAGEVARKERDLAGTFTAARAGTSLMPTDVESPNG